MPELGHIANMATTTPHFATKGLRAREFGIFFPFPFAKSQVYLSPWNI